MTGPTPPLLPDELLALTRRRRLPYPRRGAPEVIGAAKAQRWDPAEVLRVLLSEEAQGRDIATREMRRKSAALPFGKTFESWREEVRRSRSQRSARYGHLSGSSGRKGSLSRAPRAPASYIS